MTSIEISSVISTGVKDRSTNVCSTQTLRSETGGKSPETIPERVNLPSVPSFIPKVLSLKMPETPVTSTIPLATLIVTNCFLTTPDTVAPCCLGSRDYTWYRTKFNNLIIS
jgi:hypothetical protein